MSDQLAGFKRQNEAKAGRAQASQGKSSAPRPGGNSFKGYVKADLSRQERGDFDAWAEGHDLSDLVDTLGALLDSGYKFSCASREDGFMASLSCQDQESGSCGWVLTAFGSRAKSAVQALLYKHYVKLDCEWSNAIEVGEDFVR